MFDNIEDLEGRICLNRYSSITRHAHAYEDFVASGSLPVNRASPALPSAGRPTYLPSLTGAYQVVEPIHWVRGIWSLVALKARTLCSDDN